MSIFKPSHRPCQISSGNVCTCTIRDQLYVCTFGVLLNQERARPWRLDRLLLELVADQFIYCFRALD